MGFFHKSCRDLSKFTRLFTADGTIICVMWVCGTRKTHIMVKINFILMFVNVLNLSLLLILLFSPGPFATVKFLNLRNNHFDRVYFYFGSKVFSNKQNDAGHLICMLLSYLVANVCRLMFASASIRMLFGRFGSCLVLFTGSITMLR